MSSQKARSKDSGGPAIGGLHPFSAATTLSSQGESSAVCESKVNGRPLPPDLPPAYRKRTESAAQAIHQAFSYLADDMQNMWHDQRQFILQEVTTLRRLLREQHRSHSKELALMRYELDCHKRSAQKVTALEKEIRAIRAGDRSRIKEVFACLPGCSGACVYVCVSVCVCMCSSALSVRERVRG